MTGVIATIPKYQFLSAAGIPLVSGTLTVYVAGSTTKTDTWQDSALSSLNTNPIVLDSRGEATLWLDPSVSYKFVLKNAAGSPQWTADNITGPLQASSVSTFMLTVLDDTTAAAARTTLGAATSGANTDITSWHPTNSALATTQTNTAASVGEGPEYLVTTRSSGYGQYGNILSEYNVTDSIPTGELDVGRTDWVRATNLAGGSVFAAWSGANTPAAYLSQTYSSGAVIGQEINVGNRWADFGVQLDVGGTRYTVGQQIVPDVLPASDGVNSTAVTISVATPGVVTLATHGYTANMGVVFSGAGTIPTGLTKGTVYYVSATGLLTNTFQVSATIGGSSIATTGTFAGPISVTPSYPGSFAQAIGQSTWGHQWWVGTFIRGDSICAGGYAHLERGGSNALSAPNAWANVTGYWVTGLDFSAAICSGGAINFSFTDSNATTATGGSATLPANPQGFVKLRMAGGIIKVPYYQN